MFWKGHEWDNTWKDAQNVRYSAHKTHLYFSQYLPFFSLLLFFFLSLQQLPVITSNTIVRCRSCRTYINPFVTFLDQRRWKCNLCYRVNDGMSPIQKVLSPIIVSLSYHFVKHTLFDLPRSVPDEFMYNPVTRSYGEPHKRPEVQNSTVEFIASSDYMVSCFFCSCGVYM